MLDLFAYVLIFFVHACCIKVHGKVSLVRFRATWITIN